MGYASISRHVRDLAVMKKVLRRSALLRRDRRSQFARGFPQPQSRVAPPGGSVRRPQLGFAKGAAAVLSGDHPGGCALRLSRLVQADTHNIRRISLDIKWSVYLPDPEGNRLEFFSDTEWHVRQPCANPIDFSRPADGIHQIADQLNRSNPDFEPMQDWRDRLELPCSIGCGQNLDGSLSALSVIWPTLSLSHRFFY